MHGVSQVQRTKMPSNFPPPVVRINNMDGLDFKLVIAKLSAAAVSLLLAFPPMLGTLFLMMTLDYLSGLLAAGYNGRLKSSVAVRGIYKKAAELLMACGGYAITMHFPDLQFMGLSLGSGICGWLILSEFISITRNAAATGTKIPTGLRQLLARIMGEPDSRPSKPGEGA